MNVKPKKQLGQHFLKDESICQRIEQAIQIEKGFNQVLEIGPGMGALTKFLLQNDSYQTSVIEVDNESVAYLQIHYPELENRIFLKDFLNVDAPDLMHNKPFAVVGNFPYNISTQILFKVLDHKDQIPQVVGMFQKEVAQRVVQPPGTKDYGIISVFIQAFYDAEYLFTVDEHVFNPPPKVKSGVIRLTRNHVKELPCDEKFFKTVVKQAFGQRRKTLRNSLKTLLDRNPAFQNSHAELLSLRPERLSVQDFVMITQHLQV